jgi:hypothetical protein
MYVMILRMIIVLLRYGVFMCISLNPQEVLFSDFARKERFEGEFIVWFMIELFLI